MFACGKIENKKHEGKKKGKRFFDAGIRTIYEHLHESLLYTNEKQDFDTAVETFEKINLILACIGE